MTANLVTGYSQTSDYMPQMNVLPNQNSSTDFSGFLKTSTENVAEKNVTSKVTASGKPENVNNEKVDKLDTQAVEEKAINKDSNEKVTNTVNEDVNDESVVDEVVTEISDENETDISEEIMEVVATAINEMVQNVAEVLDVSEEQVVEAIDNLGFETADILNARVIPELTVELTDASDTMDIMTDENMFADVSELMKKANEELDSLAKEMDLPVEDVINQVKEAVANENEAVVLQDTESSTVTSENAVVSEKVATVQVEKEDSDISGRQRDVETVSYDAQSGVNEYQTEVNVTAKKEMDNGKNSSKDEQSANTEQSGAFGHTVLDSLKEAVAKIDDNNLLSYADTRSRIEDIMNQVSENLKLTMKGDITEMEMQLHPASLGNVKVQVAVRDGAITASFTTQNEQVRQALEAQVVELKEQLNNQGIKVEAVEVTVSSHGFERNLNEEGDKQERKSEEEAKTRKTRGINLRGLSLEELEDLDEEDKVTADMMARNGNTLDYLA